MVYYSVLFWFCSFGSVHVIAINFIYQNLEYCTYLIEFNLSLIFSYSILN